MPKRKRSHVASTLQQTEETYKWIALLVMCFFIGFFSYDLYGPGDNDVVSEQNIVTEGQKPRAIKSQHYTELGYISPVSSKFTITGKLGEIRKTPKGKTYRHQGQDLDTRAGVAILACSPGNGRVIFSGYKKNGYGVQLLIEYSDVIVLYAHLQSKAVRVKKGAIVSQGDFIGRVGSTGRSTGSHLHIEFRPKKKGFITPIFGKKQRRT